MTFAQGTANPLYGDVDTGTHLSDPHDNCTLFDKYHGRCTDLFDPRADFVLVSPAEAVEDVDITFDDILTLGLPVWNPVTTLSEPGSWAESAHPVGLVRLYLHRLRNLVRKKPAVEAAPPRHIVFNDTVDVWEYQDPPPYSREDTNFFVPLKRSGSFTQMAHGWRRTLLGTRVRPILKSLANSNYDLELVRLARCDDVDFGAFMADFNRQELVRMDDDAEHLRFRRSQMKRYELRWKTWMSPVLVFDPPASAGLWPVF